MNRSTPPHRPVPSRLLYCPLTHSYGMAWLLVVMLLLVALPSWTAPLAAARDYGARTGMVPPACRGYRAWIDQANPQTDSTGLLNTNYPEGSSTTYWTTPLQEPLGTVVTLHGRYPFSRYMSLEVYTGDQLLDYLHDAIIQPDPGQNNPFVSGTANGLYTVNLIFGQKPSNPPPNTLYTQGKTIISLMYRIYHATDPSDPAAGATNPAIPDLSLNGQTWPSCPVQPIIQPEDTTVWGRLDNGDWIGTPPTPTMRLAAYNPPHWSISNPATSHFFPSGDNYYMSATLSRQFLQPQTDENLFVLRFLAATFPNTRSGDPVYLDRQVRFWSVCTDDPYTTNVNRCIADDATVLDANGYATVVISDPGAKPSDTSLAAFSAEWLAWGALELPTDVVYDRAHKPWGISSPVQYYNGVLIRQTLANATFTQSYKAVSVLPPSQWQAAMGPYWPTGGYCSTSTFESYGPDCITH